MHTAWIRLNTVVFYAIVMLGGTCLATHVLTTYGFRDDVHAPTPNVNQLMRLVKHRGVDKAIMSFDVDYDLSSVFDINVKGVFLYISFQFETKDHSFNEVVVYDTVLMHKRDAKASATNLFTEYELSDTGTDLRGTTLNVTMAWEVMPVFGPFKNARSTQTEQFTLPAKYKRT